MRTEASVIARKLRNFYEIKNETVQEEAGILKNVFLISLMGIAVFLTHISLFILKTVKRLDG